MFTPRSWLDRVFAVGVVGKGLNGAAELVGGLVLLFLTPARIHLLIASLTSGEPTEGPGAFAARHLARLDSGLTGHGVLLAAAYLLAHGVVKVVLVVAVLRGEIWAYPWMIVVLLGFIGYQLYRIVVDPTAALVALTAFDLVIVALTWREYGLHRRPTPVGAGRS